MLEAAVDDSSQNLGLEEKVPEPGAVNGDVVTLDGVLLRSVLVGIGGAVSAIGRSGSLDLLFLFVVQKLVLDIGHLEKKKTFSRPTWKCADFRLVDEVSDD